MMLTRCPYCGATFRVTPDQLKVRQGQVRCGQCRRVFDALRGLVENGKAAPPPPPPVTVPVPVPVPSELDPPGGNDTAGARLDIPAEVPPEATAAVGAEAAPESPPQVAGEIAPELPRATAEPPHVPGLSWTIVAPAPPGTGTRADAATGSGFAILPPETPAVAPEAEPAIATGFEPLVEPSPTSAFETFKLPEPELPVADEPPEAPLTEPAPEPVGVRYESPDPQSEPNPVLEFEPEPEVRYEPAREPQFEPIHFQADPPTIFDLHEELPRAPRRWPWIAGSTLAVVLLAAQMLLHYRTEVIAASPDTRPLFTAACELLGCRIALPHKIELIGIESSDLAPDAQKPGTLYLTAMLRNRAPFAQTWPHLEITLTDAQERPLLRRSLAPDEYIPARDDLASGFARRSEQQIQLTLSAADVPAIGYRLYVYYP